MNRFGLGAGIGERDEIGDPKQWLRRQIDAWDPPADAPDASEGLDILGRLGDARRARDEDRLHALRRELRDLQLREATAGAGFMIGPRVARSRVLADWPGLAETSLYENRDLRATLDTRSVLKGVISGVFDLTRAQAHRSSRGRSRCRRSST